MAVRPTVGIAVEAAFQLLVVLVSNWASPPTEDVCEDRIDQMPPRSVNRNLRQVSFSLIKEAFAG